MQHRWISVSRCSETSKGSTVQEKNVKYSSCTSLPFQYEGATFVRNVGIPIERHNVISQKTWLINFIRLWRVLTVATNRPQRLFASDRCISHVFQPGGSGTPSPTVGHSTPPQSGSSPATDTTAGDAAVPKETFHTENELHDKPTTPSKEELETNEKNLSSSEGSAGKLGQLVFKLRLDA